MHVFDIIVVFFLFYNKYFSVEKNIWNLYLFSALQNIYHYTYFSPLRVNCLSFTTVWVGFGNFSKAIVLINNICNIYFYIIFHLFSILCILADTLLQHALQFQCLGVIMGVQPKQSCIFINFYTHMAAHSSPLPTSKSSHESCVLVPNFRYSSYGKQVYLKVLKSRPNTSFEHQENVFLP